MSKFTPPGGHLISHNRKTINRKSSRPQQTSSQIVQTMTLKFKLVRSSGHLILYNLLQIFLSETISLDIWWVLLSKQPISSLFKSWPLLKNCPYPRVHLSLHRIMQKKYTLKKMSKLQHCLVDYYKLNSWPRCQNRHCRRCNLILHIIM